MFDMEKAKAECLKIATEKGAEALRTHVIHELAVIEEVGFDMQGEKDAYEPEEYAEAIQDLETASQFFLSLIEE